MNNVNPQGTKLNFLRFSLCPIQQKPSPALHSLPVGVLGIPVPVGSVQEGSENRQQKVKDLFLVSR